MFSNLKSLFMIISEGNEMWHWLKRKLFPPPLAIIQLIYIYLQLHFFYQSLTHFQENLRDEAIANPQRELHNDRKAPIAK